MASNTEEHASTSPGSPGPKKDFKSAVIIMPPSECWDQIQAIRSKHDSAYERWMPHINLLFPFMADKGRVFEDASKEIQSAMSTIEPFTVRFTKDSFRMFRHKKKCVLWLNPLGKPNDAPHPSVLKIQSALETLYPECNELSCRSEEGFTPHLSLGQFNHRQIDQVMEEFREHWQDIEFEVKDVCLISRKDFHDPFHVRHNVPIGKA